MIPQKLHAGKGGDGTIKIEYSPSGFVSGNTNVILKDSSWLQIYVVYIDSF